MNKSSYTFSYEPNPDWSASFVEQKEIEAYLQRCATKFGLDPHITLNTKIVTADYRSDGYWVLSSEAGEKFEFDIILSSLFSSMFIFVNFCKYFVNRSICFFGLDNNSSYLNKI